MGDLHPPCRLDGSFVVAEPMKDKCPTCGNDDYAEEVCPFCVLAAMHQRGDSVSLFALREAVASVRLSRWEKREGYGTHSNQGERHHESGTDAT